MKNVLIVDDEEIFVQSLSEGLRVYASDFAVLTAFNGDEAVKILNSTSVNLVITDLNMPVMDGFELLSYMSSHYSMIPVIVMTAYGTPEIESRLSSSGVFKYLEKPLDFDSLATDIFEVLSDETRGYVRGIDLMSFLQLVEMERKTCSLRVRSQEKVGGLYFMEGMLIDAETVSLKGDEAAYEICSWNNAEIEIENFCRKKQKTIKNSLQHILLKSCNIRDEKIKLQHVTSAGNSESFQKEVQVEHDGKDNSRNVNTHDKEEKMVNVKKLNEAVESVKDNLGNSLVSTDIFSVKDGQTLAGYNTNPRATAMFTQITLSLQKALKSSGFPLLRKYYLLDLQDDKLVLIAPLGEYLWGMLVDSSKVQMGMLLNVVLPDMLGVLREALDVSE